MDPDLQLAVNACVAKLQQTTTNARLFVEHAPFEQHGGIAEARVHVTAPDPIELDAFNDWWSTAPQSWRQRVVVLPSGGAS